MIKKVLLCALALLVLGGYTGTAHAADKTAATPSQTAPDNTGRNVRDRGGDTVTPGDQSNNTADLNLTQQIRRNDHGRQVAVDRTPRTSRLSLSMVSSRCGARSTRHRRKRLLRPKPRASRGEQRR